MSSEVANLIRSAGAVPNGWRSLRLADVAILSGGTTPSRAKPEYWENATIPWATPSDITSLATGENRITNTETKVSEKALDECSLTLNPSGTVLMTSRATIGFAAINQVPMATNQGFISLRVNGDLNADFLLYWLTSQRNNLVAAAGGSTFKELSRGTAKLLSILLPPLDEQKRIAEVLRSADEAIAMAFVTNKQAQIALDSARADLLTPLADTTALGDVCDIVGGYAFKSTSFLECGVKVMRISNITEGGVDFSGRAVCVAARDVCGLDRFRLRPLDTVVALSGATTGKMCVFTFGEPVYVNQRVAFIRVKEGLADQRYINHVLSMRKASVRQSAYGGAQPNISTKEIASMEIILPSLTEQLKIAEVLDGLAQSVALGDKVLKAHQATKATLMSDLLSGRVRVPA